MDFNYIFGEVASHQFPDRDKHAPPHRTPSSETIFSDAPAEFLLTIREKERLENMGSVLIDPSTGKFGWDGRILSLKKTLVEHRWDVQKLLSKYGLHDPEGKASLK